MCPHVVTYEAAFVQDNSLFLVMEACTRGDLHAVLEAHPDQRLGEDDALRVWQQVVRGAAFLHDLGIAHRDLSLENILVDECGDVKICDFGLSAFVEKRELSVGRVGKPYYMAPEVTAELPYDAMRADVWSLGVVLFVLLTGSPLVETASPSDPAFRALETVGVAGILRHWGMDRDVSPRTMMLLHRLLQLQPATRPASAREVLGLL